MLVLSCSGCVAVSRVVRLQNERRLDVISRPSRGLRGFNARGVWPTIDDRYEEMKWEGPGKRVTS